MKKGFTLIELTISIALLSVVMIFMLNLLSNLRNKENNIKEETNLILTKTTLSKDIHKIIRKNEGINKITCTNNNCNLIMNNNNELTLKIEENILKLKNETEGKIELKSELNNHTIEVTENEILTIITLKNTLKEEYNIEIVDYKINN